MKKILVPVDFSEISKNALRFAIKIAYPLRAKIVLLHSIHPVFATDITLEEFDANLKMDDLLDYISFNEVSCEKVVRIGLLGDVVSDVAREKKPDLIISGTHAADGVDSDIFFDTNSLTIFDRVSCPVIIVPAKARTKAITKIMYATDFQFGDLEELRKVCLLAQVLNASVLAVHISKESEQKDSEESMGWFEDMESERIQYNKLSYKIVYHQSVTEGLQQAVKSFGADMLCMSTLEKSFLKKLFTKSNIEEVVHEISIPLLAVRLTEENKQLS